MIYKCNFCFLFLFLPAPLCLPLSLSITDSHLIWRYKHVALKDLINANFVGSEMYAVYGGNLEHMKNSNGKKAKIQS